MILVKIVLDRVFVFWTDLLFAPRGTLLRLNQNEQYFRKERDFVLEYLAKKLTLFLQWLTVFYYRMFRADESSIIYEN